MLRCREPDRGFSVVIVGGGPAGAMCARQLGIAGFDVALIERSDFSKRRVGETCGPSVAQFLRNQCELKMPATIARQFPRFYSAWGAESLITNDYRFWEASEGAVLDRPAFDKWVLGEAIKAGAATFLGATILSCRREDNHWLMQIAKSGGLQSIKANFVVEATGRVAASLFQPDAKRIFIDRLVALSHDVSARCDDDGATIVESSQLGWWYSTLLPSRRRLLVYFTDADLLPKNSTVGVHFATELRATKYVSGVPDTSSINEIPAVSDARTSARRVIWRDRWVAIGDCCYSLDPLSGSGILRAFKSGVDSATALRSFLGMGDTVPLQHFAVSRGQAFSAALSERTRHYSLERRWPQSPFWIRRIQNPN